ncbi:unnamed protein product [Ilex paraguariensis]|uniref:Legumain prodomain domain-containing protein n=1 Tax=Ilex paraguariensis TaxID=185542 RepID=A0ABC8QZ72_9AQUA
MALGDDRAGLQNRLDLMLHVGGVRQRDAIFHSLWLRKLFPSFSAQYVVLFLSPVACDDCAGLQNRLDLVLHVGDVRQRDAIFHSLWLRVSTGDDRAGLQNRLDLVLHVGGVRQRDAIFHSLWLWVRTGDDHAGSQNRLDLVLHVGGVGHRDAIFHSLWLRVGTDLSDCLCETCKIGMWEEPRDDRASSQNRLDLMLHVGGVRQRDAIFHSLRLRYKNSKDGFKKTKVIKEIRDTMARRKYFDGSVDIIALFLFGPGKRRSILKSGPVMNHRDCLPSMMQVFATHCGGCWVKMA